MVLSKAVPLGREKDCVAPFCGDLHFRRDLDAIRVGKTGQRELLDDLGVDPQVRADQMGHGVDVNQNDYTRASLEHRQEAVNALEKAVGVM